MIGSGLVYASVFGGIAVTAVQDLFQLTAPADAAVILLSVRLSQSSDAGDLAAEMLRVEIARATTGGSGGTAITEEPLQAGFPAAGSAVVRQQTTVATGLTILVEDGWNIQAGWLYQPPPEERIVVSPSGIIVVSLPLAPADSLTMSGTITWAEIGG